MGIISEPDLSGTPVAWQQFGRALREDVMFAAVGYGNAYATQQRRKCLLGPRHEITPYQWPTDLNGKRLVVLASSTQLGDTLWLGPCLRKLRECFPTMHLTIVTTPKAAVHYTRMGIRYDRLLCVPLAADQWPAGDYLWPILSGYIFESHKEGSPVRAMAATIDMPVEDVTLRYDCTFPERQIAARLFEGNDRAKIMVHELEAGSSVRRYARMNDVVGLLVNMDLGVVRIVTPLTVGVMVALMERMELFIGYDSGPLNLTSVVGVPALGLYGPMGAVARTSDYPNIVPIQPAESCSPCWNNLGCERTHQPSCEALNAIEPQAIVDKALEVLKCSTITTAPVAEQPKPKARRSPRAISSAATSVPEGSRVSRTTRKSTSVPTRGQAAKRASAVKSGRERSVPPTSTSVNTGTNESARWGPPGSDGDERKQPGAAHV